MRSLMCAIGFIKEALTSVITFAFDNIGDALNYKERFSIIDAFEKHGYVQIIKLLLRRIQTILSKSLL